VSRLSVVAGVLLVSVAVLVFGVVRPASSAEPAAQVTAYAASLAVGGERPAAAGVPAGATGLFSGLVTEAAGKQMLSWRLSFGHLSGAATAAHIHLGRPGQAGPVALPLCGPCKSGAQGVAPLDAKLAAALQSGGAYVNVHTKKNPGGEIRGQVGASHALAAALDATGEAPPPSNVPAGAKGLFSGLVIDATPRPLIVWSLRFSGLSGSASAAHIHLGKAGAAGPVALALCGPCSASVQGRKAIDPNLAAAIAGGGTYVNVHTAANPAGEIRGQVNHATQGVSARTSSLGTILVDDRGKTLYMWEADKGTQSACYGRCAVVWPPAFAYGPPVAGAGTKAALLGVAARSDGTSMLTYGGRPLYGFLPDSQPGDMKGQGSNGFGAPWWVLDANAGTVITTKTG